MARAARGGGRMVGCGVGDAVEGLTVGQGQGATEQQRKKATGLEVQGKAMGIHELDLWAMGYKALSAQRRRGYKGIGRGPAGSSGLKGKQNMNKY